MPRNGSGVFSPPGANYPAVAGTTITAANRNAVDSDIATALTGSVATNGESVITNDIPMSNNKVTGLKTGTAATDATNLGQVQSGASTVLSSVSGTDTITATLSPTLTAYASGQMFKLVPANTNTGAVTININSLGAKAITKNGATALVAGDLVAGVVYILEYDGTQFQAIAVGLQTQITALDAEKADLAGATFTGDVVMSGATFIPAKGADVASATALPLITDGNYFDVTGTTTITSFNTVGVGAVVKLHFDGALILTHHATDLILPSGANITTAAGDEAEFVEYATGDWRCTNYVRANGVPVSSWVYLAKQNATSGTSITFSDIPSWVTEIEMIGTAVSTTGTSGLGCQIGDAGGLETSGYSGMCSRQGNSGAAVTANSNRFFLHNLLVAAQGYDFNLRLAKYDGNTWAMTGSCGDNAGSAASYASTIGTKTLSDTLTQLAFLSSSDNFDGTGTIVVRYR